MIGDLACNAGALCLAGGGAKPPHRGGVRVGETAREGGGLVGGGRRGINFFVSIPLRCRRNATTR